MVFKSTGLKSHGFNAKTSFEKDAPSPEILPKSVQKSAFQKRATFDKFWLIFQDLVHIFQNQFFSLKPGVQAGQFEYHEPYNPNNF